MINSKTWVHAIWTDSQAQVQELKTKAPGVNISFNTQDIFAQQ